jgi:hypothetical protein
MLLSKKATQQTGNAGDLIPLVMKMMIGSTEITLAEAPERRAMPQLQPAAEACSAYKNIADR